MNNNTHLIINVGRRLGAGGHDIGQLLATHFHATYYDRELLNLAARESGFSEKFFEQNDERKGFFKGLFNVQTSHLTGSNIYRSNFSQESLFQFQSDAIRHAADQGPCVFVGRCADYVLRDYPCAVNIFITAPLDFRIRQLTENRNMDAETARKTIEQGESKRAAYYNYYTGKRWGHAASYHLCVDSSILGIEQTADFIADFIQKKLNNHQ